MKISGYPAHSCNHGAPCRTTESEQFRQLGNLPDTSRSSAIITLFENVSSDVRATIGTLLADIKFLKEQLAVTQIEMSIGFTRGWQPSFERDVGEESADAGKS